MNPITQIWTMINYICSILPKFLYYLYTYDNNNGPGGSGQKSAKLLQTLSYDNDGDRSVSVEDELKNPKATGLTFDRISTVTEKEKLEVDLITEDDDGSSWEDDDEYDDLLAFDICEDVTPVPCINDTKTTDINNAKLFYGFHKFSIVDHLPPTHKFFFDEFRPVAASDFMRAYHKDLKILRQGLPNGIFVKGFEQRMDLFSALIVGPEGTPYESGVFAFDIKLPSKYPHRPPKFHYISYTKKTRLNPNLYTNGKVCVSLLGTWPSRDTCESWSCESTLLQVLISIQGLILVQEPYFNEPGKIKSPSDITTSAYSKNYNENVILKLFQGTIAMLHNPPMPWTLELMCIFKHELPKLIARVEGWTSAASGCKPAFPLTPMWRHHEILQLIQELKQAHKKYCNI